jgi:predicted nucleotidyltransferase
MLDIITKSSVRRKVLGLFVLNPTHQLYPRYIAQLIDESPHAVGLELKYLVQGGMLETVGEGKRTYYTLNESYPFMAELTAIINKMRAQGNEEMRMLPDLAQAASLKENLARVVENLKRYYDPEKIIVFGSAASGNVGPYSDIDLVVVKETSLPYFKRLQQLAELINYDTDIDFVIYTPEEFERAAKENAFVKKEIIAKGKVLYDKTA